MLCLGDCAYDRYVLLYPLVMLVTPSPAKVIQSILFALQAPVRYGPLDTSLVPLSEVGKVVEPVDQRRSGTRGGDVIRDCAVVEYVLSGKPGSLLMDASMPPILSDLLLAKATYEKLEKDVEKGVRESATRERAFATPRTSTEPGDKDRGG